MTVKLVLRMIWLAGCVICARAGAEPFANPDLSWLDRQAIDAGEIPLKLEKRGKATKIETAVRIDAPPAVIWKLLVSCDMAPDIVPHVISCRSLETLDGGRSEIFEQVVKPAFFLPTFEHEFRLDYEPYHRITISRVEGPLDPFEGFWWFETETDGSTLLYYSLTIDPGIPVPRLFVRSTLRRELPALLTAIRDLAESGQTP